MSDKDPGGRGAGKRLATAAILFSLVVLLMPVHGDAWQKQGGPCGQLRVVVTEIESDAGTIRIALFDSEENYKGAKKPLRTAAVKIKKKKAETVFDNLPCGIYAVRLYHDANDNGKLDRDGRGMPLEPYAFSNNAVGTMGPAIWSDARFTIQSKNTKINIRLD